ncbi:MAG: hypothetical protein IPO88_27815 [Nannocystis sp.]|uniref:MYXO-CTERM sorting domain-containing protein n=1 Tax=Nannocystis sp. TaxID=1962667 RepID=UPI002429FBD7|nr:MYXO-CTERM sorting domain-containing protein [Nannocystis sp.]MBK9757237.1 hypothetical protein [Nannocystis sp.]
MNLRTIVLLSFGAFLTGTRPAHADTPPPVGYKEKCKVELKEQEGTTCEECQNGPGDGGDPERCEKQFAGTEFAYACQTYGASFWTEVWCKGPPREDEGCSCALPGAGATGNAALAGLVVIAFGRRRRRMSIAR